MPELPEMETYRSLLSEHVTGRTITNIEINRPKSINTSPDAFERELVKNRVTAIDRRAKHLIFRLDTGKNLLLHLMLGGWMYLGNDNDSPGRTKQVVIAFGDMKLFFIGLRLGYLHLLSGVEMAHALAGLGPEPLDPGFTFEKFHGRVQQRKGTLKTMLVNQQIIAGIGNSYSDEICFEARLRPTKKVSELPPDGLRRLYDGMRSVLNLAVATGGNTETPLFSGDRKTGGYLSTVKVYDREGEPCKRCGATIIKEIVTSRKTFYCPNCQKE
ncbi:bifunctional DNA-formamidopyrimidine glycosylase/DNA-(apurinic or apyrimidinic site) lyase [Bacillus sp. T33-2]|uniref:bifunctional DNA-formamidopyrimidine glycosylase/DNA-(apurinic or apyrimidinic site) lyase n=1 Tax=Bacillus sp. T33-2 TaxID=2054168 RepID=UPI000C75D2E1|nr:bifunctional DNA-formamidopyrimidine glycosylase/DNA-(apurinic or apyrimidinic site) lyase [Bacillus sp. T33-2]PLR96071.1 endonuclease VIII [Bacillus sp. T33-2]